jgi:hypothetical protein
MGVFDPIIELSKGLGETFAPSFLRRPLPINIQKRSDPFVRASAAAMF